VHKRVGTIGAPSGGAGRFAVSLALALTAFLAPWCADARGTASQLAPNFTLTDQRGHAFTLSHERGHPVVLFFGYTHCPDVCPTILANLRTARATLGAKAADTIVALITVDAARDTKAELGQFVATFDPSFLGLTGSSAQLKPVYRDYHVRYAKQEEGPGGYLVSHTAFVYYIGRDGRVKGFGTWNDPQDILKEDLKSIVDSH
jgi:protein SCO1/2